VIYLENIEEPTAFMYIIYYLYTGVLKQLDSVRFACSVLDIADRYLEENVKNYCIEFLKNDPFEVPKKEEDDEILTLEEGVSGT
jgi:hypothetical protein